MSVREPAQVTVRILEKEYFVACPPEEREDLVESATFLNARMREIRDSGKVIGLDRIAVMAALNMANELLRSRNVGEALEGNAKLRLQAMRERIEGALQAGRQLDL